MTTTARDRLLTGVGLLAFLLYVLACRPAFSPDGTKVLVPIRDDAHATTAVWVYDRVQKSWAKVLETAETPLPSVNWTGDGREAVIAWGTSSNQLHVVAVPLSPSGPPRRYSLTTKTKCEGAFILSSPPVIGRFFYHGDSNAVYRLDLRDGSVTTGVVADVGEIVVLPHPRGLAGLTARQLGLLDPDRLTFTPVQAVPGEAAVVVGERVISQATTNQFVVYHQGKRERELSVDASLTVLELAAGLSNDVVYATALRKNGELCIGELPLRDAPARWTTLCATTDTAGNDLICRLAVSPDGQTIAFSTGLAEKGIAPADWALYFVDLTSPTRKVTKVPLPVPPPAKQ